jgi:hypothetical protein
MQDFNADEYFEQLRNFVFETLPLRTDLIECIEREAENHLAASRLALNFVRKIKALNIAQIEAFMAANQGD